MALFLAPANTTVAIFDPCLVIGHTETFCKAMVRVGERERARERERISTDDTVIPTVTDNMDPTAIVYWRCRVALKKSKEVESKFKPALPPVSSVVANSRPDIR